MKRLYVAATSLSTGRTSVDAERSENETVQTIVVFLCNEYEKFRWTLRLL